jgi:hypothetical protein
MAREPIILEGSDPLVRLMQSIRHWIRVAR